MSPIYGALLLILAVLLTLHFGRLEDLRKRARALMRIETKLDLLLRREGIEYEPYKGLPGEAVAALKRGEKIGAIEAYRAATRISLKEAKDRIEEAQRLADL